ncbi:MAG TPA: DMT family transporter [Acidimicrobiales bacterium]|nr:DMT family transporter [Acidimicrobiales bacterium]
MLHDWVVVALGLGAAFAFALSSSLKHVSAGHQPDAQSMHLGKLRRFVGSMLSHPLWLGGIGCDVVGLTLQVFALHIGALTVVQPLLVSGLLFALVLRQFHEHHQISGRQMAWATVLCAALAGFVVLAASGNNAHRHESADHWPAAVVGACGIVLAGVCVELGRRQRRGGRSAALLGIAVGTIYAALAALLKAVTDIVARSPLDVFTSWQLYVVLIVGALGLLLNQLAFQAGPITASLPAVATVDPLLSVVVGVVVYDEHIRSGPGGGVVLALLVILLGAAVIQVARTPGVAQEAAGSSGSAGDLG